MVETATTATNKSNVQQQQSIGQKFVCYIFYISQVLSAKLFLSANLFYLFFLSANF
ncbi:unnamed protein product [Meloidogyne enterolobii]|uniref:Uncharacterized protein n=1 Tax=Meloidogyne enterolobii TaxID=390850 RepID=A0ACB1AAU4_MELEN